MHVFLEKKTLQGRTHLEDAKPAGARLASFLEILHGLDGGSRTVWTDVRSAGDLEGADVYVVPTLIEPLPPEAVEAVDGFVARGGGLFLLSNHDPYHQHDGALARRFGVTLEKTFFRTPGGTTPLRDGDLHAHPLLAGGRDPVSVLVTNTTCSILSRIGRPLADLPRTMEDKSEGRSPEGRLFGLAVDGQQEAWKGRRGRMVAVADSGFLGDRESRKPGPGLIEEGDNRAFLRRAVRWLAGGGDAETK